MPGLVQPLLALVPARACRPCVVYLSASGAVALSPGPSDELRSRLDLIRRDEREAEALEERGWQRHLREGHRRGVADDPPQARVHVGADAGEDPRVFDSVLFAGWRCGGNLGPKPTYAARPKSLRYCMELL